MSRSAQTLIFELRQSLGAQAIHPVSCLQAESGRTPGSYLSPGIVEMEDGVAMTMVRLGEGSVTMLCNSERPFGMDA